jgi:hypothetical protein
MPSPKSRLLYDNMLGQIANLKRTSEQLSISCGLLESSITSHYRQDFSELSSHPNTLFTPIYQHFLLILKLLKHLSALKSAIGIQGLTSSTNLKVEVPGKSWEIQAIDGRATKIHCPSENFEQLELDIYPGMP